MTTVLGVDLGERRIGIAIAEPDGYAARALVTVPRRRSVQADAATLQDLIDTHHAVELVVGLPLEAGGAEGRQATATRAWVEALRPLLTDDVRITFQDERLSSHVAEGRLGPMPRGRAGGPPTRKQRDLYRARVDREAAAIILQDALDARRAHAARSISTMETAT